MIEKIFQVVLAEFRFELQKNPYCAHLPAWNFLHKTSNTWTGTENFFCGMLYLKL